MTEVFSFPTQDSPFTVYTPVFSVQWWDSVDSRSGIRIRIRIRINEQFHRWNRNINVRAGIGQQLLELESKLPEFAHHCFCAMTRINPEPWLSMHQYIVLISHC